MDLLFSRYASPMEFMSLYIENGRFGEFVEEIINLNNTRKQEEQRKDEDSKLWTAYLFSMSGLSFNEWKKGLTRKAESPSLSMTDNEIGNVKQGVRDILKNFKPV